MDRHLQVVRIKAVANALGPLRDQVVFLGGAAVSLYANRQVPEIRPTDDVDILVEILHYGAWEDLETRLRNLGFQHDTESNIICRFRVHGIVVDVLPTSGAVFGFTNRWYQPGFHAALDYEIDPHLTIKILPGPYFLATKIEAFNSRGNSDGRTSQDFEDLIFILENRSSIWWEMENADADVKDYLRKSFSTFLKVPYLEEWIDGHVERGYPNATKEIVGRLSDFVGKRN